MDPHHPALQESELVKLIRRSAKANNLILEQLKFFRDIIGQLNIAIFIHDLTLHRHVWTNHNYSDIIGYTEKEMDGMAPEWVRENCHPEDLHILLDRIDHFRQNGGVTYAGIYRIKHKKGHWVWIYSNSAVFKRGKDGRPEQIIGICIDFSSNFKTDRQLDELQRENHRLKNRLLICSLTQREKEILFLVSSGKKYKEIASALRISAHTVNSHRKHLLSKLNVHSTAELGRIAAEFGLD